MKLSVKIVGLLIAAALAWLLLMLFVPGARQDGLFFCSGQERQWFDFMGTRAVLTAARPYIEETFHPAIGHVLRQDQCYPALGILIAGLFSDSVYGALTCQLVGSAVYFLGVSLFLAKYGVFKSVYVASLLISAPFLFAAEVGNQIVYAAGATFVFLAWYDSDRRWRRVLAALALAFAATLKITPVLLGFAYLATPARRDWRGAILAGLFFAILLLVPFAFLGGTDAFFAWLENAQKNSSVYVLRNAFGPYGLLCGMAEVFGYKYNLQTFANLPLRIASSLFAVVLLIRAFAKGRDEFVRLCLISLGMLFLPPTMMCYTSLYVVPLFLVGAARYDGRLAKAFGWCWLLTCVPLQVPLVLGSANVCFSAAAMIDLSVLLCGRIISSSAVHAREGAN